MSEETPEAVASRAAVFGALADPTRLRIYETIVGADGPVNVTELCNRTGLQTSLVSHHLRHLRDVSLVTSERRGRKRFYELSTDLGADLVGLAGQLVEERDVDSSDRDGTGKVNADGDDSRED